MAANDTRAPSLVAVDARTLTNATVERNGKNVGRVERVMINPTTGRIDHVIIDMTDGQNRSISVPWSAVQMYQDSSGTMTMSLTDRAAADASPSASPRMTIPSPAPDTNVRVAQRQLNALGYYPGPVDGVMGPQTHTALRTYQRDRSLTITGRLDARTTRSLNNEVTPSVSR
jgi:hypothetical protein